MTIGDYMGIMERCIGQKVELRYPDEEGQTFTLEEYIAHHHEKYGLIGTFRSEIPFGRRAWYGLLLDDSVWVKGTPETLELHGVHPGTSDKFTLIFRRS